jgi:hypothetical protein
MYIDESGDPGLKSSISNYFVLSGLIIHETDWIKLLNEFRYFRQKQFQKYRLPVRAEIHAGAMINGRLSDNYNIQKNERFLILRSVIDWLASYNQLRIVSVIVDKTNFTSSEEVFEFAWRNLIQRFENFLNHINKKTGLSEHGIIIPDNTNGDVVKKIERKMRKINYIPSKYSVESRNVPIYLVIEDPFFKDSAESYFTQMIDVVSYFSLQFIQPNKYVRKHGAKKFFTRLDNIFLKEAAPKDLYGRVWISKRAECNQPGGILPPD